MRIHVYAEDLPLRYAIVAKETVAGVAYKGVCLFTRAAVTKPDDELDAVTVWFRNSAEARHLADLFNDVAQELVVRVPSMLAAEARS